MTARRPKVACGHGASIDFRSTLAFPAEKVFATMVDEEYLRARLRELGGPGSELLEHQASPDGARYRLRQGLSQVGPAADRAAR